MRAQLVSLQFLQERYELYFRAILQVARSREAIAGKCCVLAAEGQAGHIGSSRPPRVFRALHVTLQKGKGGIGDMEPVAVEWTASDL